MVLAPNIAYAIQPLPILSRHCARTGPYAAGGNTHNRTGGPVLTGDVWARSLWDVPSAHPQCAPRTSARTSLLSTCVGSGYDGYIAPLARLMSPTSSARVALNMNVAPDSGDAGRLGYVGSMRDCRTVTNPSVRLNA